MPDPVTLEDLRALAEALEKSEITTLEDLKRSIGVDQDEGFTRVSSETKISETLLAAVLIAGMKEDAGRKDNGKLLHHWRDLVNRPKHLFSWKKHWLDLVVFVILPIGFAGLMVRAYSINKKAVPYVAVKREAALPAFQKIGQQVELKGLPGAKGAFTSSDQVQGLYTLAAIPAGAVLKSNQVLNKTLSDKMNGRRILTVPIKVGSYNSTIKPPIAAIMVLSPRDPNAKASEGVVFEVIVLSIDQNGEARSATVALPEDRFLTTAALLASHDVFLTQSTP